MEQAQDIAEGAYRFLGNARFERDGAVMYSDSAYFYGKKNVLGSIQQGSSGAG